MPSRYPTGSISSPIARRSSRRSLLGRGLALGAAGLTGSLAGRSSVAAQDKTELTFMHWGSLLEKEEMAKTIEAFEELHPDISVDQQYIPGDYDTKLNALVAAGDVPDVFYIGSGPLFEWALEGRLLDFTPYVEQYPTVQDRLPQTFMYSEPGRTVGNWIAIEMCTLYYNRDLYDEAGVPYPPATAETAWTWDQLVETAKLLTLDNDGRNATESDFDPDNIKQYGITIPRWFYAWYPLVRSNGGDITDETGTQFTLDSPEAVDVFQKLQDLIYVHHVSPTPTQEENLPATNIRLQTRRVATAIDGQWALLDVAAAGINFSVGVLPKLQEPVTHLSCASTVINADTPNLEAAIEFYVSHTNPQLNITPFANGLWMPMERKYYTDQALIDSWTANDAHPPEYRTAVMDYTLNHGVRGPAEALKNWASIDPRGASSLDPLWTGEKNAQDALADMKAAVQPLLEGKTPTE
ncbi:MAG: ABC transporter substrate-binding protein [Thermomicrobiales bacterium]